MYDEALSIFVFLIIEVGFIDILVEVHAVESNMIYRSLTRLPVIVLDGDHMEHLPCANVNV